MNLNYPSNNSTVLPLRILVLCFVFLCFQTKAQRVDNVKASISGDIIIVSYDLIAETDETFNVNLYSSKDNFQQPLTLVTGDVGINITAGKGKRIEWLAKNELQDYKGNLIFEVRAFLPEPAFDPLEFVNFDLKEIKSGKSYRLQWKGGKENEKIDIMLFEDGNEKYKISTINNEGRYLWKIPKGNKSSSYQIQLKGETGIVASNSFQIKKGFPGLLVGGGALLVGGITAAIIILDPFGGDEGNDLPIAPDPN
ncbi:hypothetical protein [Marivirga sp.]|uniref:hypothetical protein n=1 Tax=Marivirga sp. TaxID=2018662 RepID=UPI003DA6D7DA